MDLHNLFFSLWEKATRIIEEVKMGRVTNSQDIMEDRLVGILVSGSSTFSLYAFILFFLVFFHLVSAPTQSYIC